eukprot:6209427-Pleurochrysis_carterae.AAC.1
MPVRGGEVSSFSSRPTRRVLCNRSQEDSDRNLDNSSIATISCASRNQTSRTCFLLRPIAAQSRVSASSEQGLCELRA